MSELLNNVRSRIESLGIGFQFVKTVKTGTNGAERETWLLEYESSQFIFVPGRKHVTLGWDTDQCPLGEGVLEGLQKEFSSGHEYYYEEEMENLKGDYQEQIEEAEENGDSVKADELRAELEEELEQMNKDIEEKGYGKYFTHRTGHSIGLEDHEFGDVSSVNEDIIQVGQCFSVEPGIYLADEGIGVRIEDLVIITEDGCEVLNSFTKDLIVVPEE